ncbi:type II toxin-antitoxin system PemK/MazF family toxin [Candidatus Poribacteria bacterium]|nr:type II toxin-antitoxin system PemK/MazF family toxin [Candidatus Poribacteria bacterium]
MNYKRGDVVLCQVPTPSSEFRQFKLRPAVIVSKDHNNNRLDDVMIATCTSNISRSREPTQYLITYPNEIAQAGLKVSSVVKCESLLTINKSMILKVLGRLSDEVIEKLNACLMDALGLP